MTSLDYMIRQSEASAWDFCRRHHNLRYTRGLAPLPAEGRRMPDSGQRDLGTAFHAGAEIIHLDGTPALALDAVTHKVNDLRWQGVPEVPKEHEVPPPLANDDEWAKVNKLARVMVEGYHEWLQESGLDAGFETKAVEHEWEVPLRDTGITLFGKIDLVGWSHEHHGIVVDDCKTVERLEEPHRADFQLRTYAWAWWRSTGEVPVRAGHRQARRVLRSARSKPPYYANPQIPINQTILEAHEAQLIERCLDIVSARTRDTTSPVLYPRTSRDCSWRCPFGDVCVMIDDGDDFEFVLDQNFRVLARGEDG